MASTTESTERRPGVGGLLRIPAFQALLVANVLSATVFGNEPIRVRVARRRADRLEPGDGDPRDRDRSAAVVPQRLGRFARRPLAPKRLGALLFTVS
ncbi:MAG: hypothetical protein R2697_06655 [Ilumatobacteraceae bacterium]